MDSPSFVLMAYKKYLEQKQWPTFWPKPAKWDKDAGWRNSTTPLLISECQRLIINWDHKNEMFHSHPWNMPKASVEVIELVGTIVRRQKELIFLKLDVWDGSGTIEVNFKVKEDEKVKASRSKLDEHFGVTPEINDAAFRVMKQVISDDGCTTKSAEQRRRFQREYGDWWDFSYKGMYGKNLEVGDYVNVFGFCALKYHTAEKYDPDADTPWDLGVLPKMIFTGLHVDAIDEETYVNKLTNLVHEGIYKYGKIRPQEVSEKVIESEPKLEEEKPISFKSENDSSVHWSQYMEWGTDMWVVGRQD